MGSVTFFAPALERKTASGNVLHRSIANLRTWFRGQREQAQLAAMSDYQLKDIGLTRGDLYRELHGE